MRIFLKITKIFFGLSLLISLNTSFAAKFNFHIINSSDSIVDPITITSGYIQAYSSSDDPACWAKKQILPVISVLKGGEQVIIYDPEYPASCYSDQPGGAHANLYVVTVDGKGINGICELRSQTEDSNENVYSGTVKITEMKDRFLCEFPIGALKR